eukprot:scaffold522225_cov37-Prasinocladus_malaysianus.AAC.1
MPVDVIDCLVAAIPRQPAPDRTAQDCYLRYLQLLAAYLRASGKTQPSEVAPGAFIVRLCGLETPAGVARIRGALLSGLKGMEGERIPSLSCSNLLNPGHRLIDIYIKPITDLNHMKLN